MEKDLNPINYPTYQTDLNLSVFFLMSDFCVHAEIQPINLLQSSKNKLRGEHQLWQRWTDW